MNDLKALIQIIGEKCEKRDDSRDEDRGSSGRFGKSFQKYSEKRGDSNGFKRRDHREQCRIDNEVGFRGGPSRDGRGGSRGGSSGGGFRGGNQRR